MNVFLSSSLRNFSVIPKSSLLLCSISNSFAISSALPSSYARFVSSSSATVNSHTKSNSKLVNARDFHFSNHIANSSENPILSPQSSSEGLKQLGNIHEQFKFQADSV